MIASKLRGVLTDSGLDGAAALTGAFGCYRLELPQESWVDILAAESAAADAEGALAAGDLSTARAEGALASSLAQQPLLPGDDGAWVEKKRRELTQVRLRALTVLADACLRSGDSSESATWAEQVTALEPFRESGYRRLMEAHVAAGNRAEALRVYERCRRLLAEELGTYPSPETESIYRSLLDAPPGPRERSPAGEAPPTPEGERARGSPGRRRAALLLTALLIAAVVAAALALVSHGGHPSPRVLPNSVVRIDPHTLKVTQVVPVVDAPDLVVASGGFVWITSHILRDTNSGALRNAGDRALTRLDPSNGKAEVVGGGLAPCGLTTDPSGDVWLANCYSGTAGPRDNVVRVDARTLHFKKTFSVSGGEGFLRGLAYGGGSLWVTALFGGDFSNDSTLTEVDPQTGAEHTFQLAPESGGLAWSEGYGDLWIANFMSGSLTRLHAASGAMKTTSSGGNPAFPVVESDAVWVADWGEPRVVRLHAVGPVKPRTVWLPIKNFTATTWDVAAGAGAVWATTPRDHAVWRIDPKTSSVRRISVPFAPTGVAADANAVWVTVRKG
ncbi:MAG TPA: BTAD domain-containing putative transcriptional regulator [Gaiellaceae bacterium]|nr:BTAD domain-containing putative transcriptional regulator [Gaiellaceae bacterium]